MGGKNQISKSYDDLYDLANLLDSPHGPLSDERKVRTFICACCRLLWDKLPDVARRALEVAEGYVEGSYSADRLLNERVELWEYLGEESCNFASSKVNAVRAVICCLYAGIPEDELYDTVMHTLEFCNDVEVQYTAQYQLMREVFGNSG